jgi:hypothetical protein
MREIDGMAAYTKLVYVDEHGEKIPKLSFLQKDFMSMEVAKYPRMRLVLQKSNALVFKFLQRFKLSKKEKVRQIKNIEDLSQSDQQEFTWFKKVWVSKTFQGKFMDAYGMEVSAVNMLDVSMDLCDECCVTIDISIVTKLDRSKGNLVPNFPSTKVPVLSPKKSLVYSRLSMGLGLSCQPKQHSVNDIEVSESPVLFAKRELNPFKQDGLVMTDLVSPGKLSPIHASSATSNSGSPVKDRMSRLPVRPSLFLRKFGSSVQNCSPKERGSPSPGLTQNHNEGRQEREQLWSREPVLMPSLIESMKRVSTLKGENSALLGLIE